MDERTEIRLSATQQATRKPIRGQNRLAGTRLDALIGYESIN